MIREQYESTETPDALNIAHDNFEENLKISLKDEAWGNSNHLIALSTIIGKNIYVYSSFKIRNKFQLNRNIGLKGIDNHFKNSRKLGFKIGHHLRYEPLINEVFPKSNDNCLYGFLSNAGTMKAHYTAIIPKFKQDSLMFRPLNCFTNLN